MSLSAVSSEIPVFWIQLKTKEVAREDDAFVY